MSLIPAKTSGLKLSSWVFGGRVPKDCGYAPIKVAGTGTCSSCISKDQEQKRSVAAELAESLVRCPFTHWLPPITRVKEKALAHGAAVHTPRAATTNTNNT